MHPSGGDMATGIIIKHKYSGMMKNGAYGFSWIYLFFGWFVPMFRGELSVAALHFLFCFLTFGLTHLIFSFIYNKQYMTRMLQNEWELAGTDFENRSAQAALGMAEQLPV